MASAATYSKYLAQVKAKDPSVLLGNLVWYSVVETVRVKHADLVAALAATGLEANQPPAPKDEDVFRRVATSHQRKNVETNDPDIRENYMIRDVKRGPDVYVKHIVVEKVNARGKKLGYEPSVQLQFTVATGKIEITSIGNTINQQAENLADLIKRDFHSDRGHVNAYGLRELLRKVVNGTGATCVKPTGGIYFIMAAQQEKVDALVKFTAGIDGVTFHPVPLVNDADQQSMLRAAFEAETKGAVEERLQQIDTMMSGPEITARRYADLLSEMHSLMSKTGGYRELLDDTLANTDLVLRSYEAKMTRLALHVK